MVKNFHLLQCLTLALLTFNMDMLLLVNVLLNYQNMEKLKQYLMLL